LGIVCLIGATAVLAVPTGCSGDKRSVCPAYSFNEPWILRIERSGVVFAIALVVAGLLWYSIIKGQMPISFGFSSASITYAQDQAAASTKQLARQLKKDQIQTSAGIAGAVESANDLKSALTKTQEETSTNFRALEKVTTDLEKATAKLDERVRRLE
jgi:preprotein translocase subunit YajC